AAPASVASQHPGQRTFETILLHAQPQTLWPDPCVQGSAGAALHPGVDWTGADLPLRKGTRQQGDTYSAFRENHGPDGER
ncbi:nicotinamidase, partial [Stenotrophomonas maltophilia]